MHSLFTNLADNLAVEQRENAETQRQIFAMMKTLQDFVLEGATKAAQNLGNISQKLNSMHQRCIPEYTRQSYDLGIDAVKFRMDHNKLQKNEGIDRQAAEELMRAQRLQDLNIFQEFIPKQKPPRTSRTIRAVTRQITSQLNAANLETKNAKNPLSKVESIPPKPRDATPEVRIHNCLFLYSTNCIYVFVFRRCSTW